MPIELVYANKESLPIAFQNEDVFKELFTVGDDGKIVLTGVTGMKTKKDVDSIAEVLRKEREEHNKLKPIVKAWGDLKPDEVLPKLSRIEELEALVSAGKLDDKKIQEMVESRIVQKTAPLQRSLEEAAKKTADLEQENIGLKKAMEDRDRSLIVRASATDTKAHASALADIEMAASVMLEKDASGDLVTKAGISGVTPGLQVSEWLKEMMKIRPHWWPDSVGGGGRGANGPGGYNGVNPWTAEAWNLTEQGRIVRSKGQEFANNLAKAAGSENGRKPIKK